MPQVWSFDRLCPCDRCKGMRNNHAWAFYYFCKRKGDKVSWKINEDAFQVIVWEKNDAT